MIFICSQLCFFGCEALRAKNYMVAQRNGRTAPRSATGKSGRSWQDITFDRFKIWLPACLAWSCLEIAP